MQSEHISKGKNKYFKILTLVTIKHCTLTNYFLQPGYKFFKVWPEFHQTRYKNVSVNFWSSTLQHSAKFWEFVENSGLFHGCLSQHT